MGESKQEGSSLKVLKQLFVMHADQSKALLSPLIYYTIRTLVCYNIADINNLIFSHTVTLYSTFDVILVSVSSFRGNSV